MGHGAKSVFTATMVSGNTTTSAIDVARAWYSAYLEIPTMNSNTNIHIQGSADLTGTYRRIYHPPINSSTSGLNLFVIISGVTNAIVPIPGGVRFMKIETTATVDNGCVFKLHCGDA